MAPQGRLNEHWLVQRGSWAVRPCCMQSAKSVGDWPCRTGCSPTCWGALPQSVGRVSPTRQFSWIVLLRSPDAWNKALRSPTVETTTAGRSHSARASPMYAEQIHLLLNHLPVVGMMLATMVGLYAWRIGSTEIIYQGDFSGKTFQGFLLIL